MHTIGSANSLLCFKCIFVLKYSRWNAIVVDGHDINELDKAFFSASNTEGKPTAIIAKTLKGSGFVGRLT